MLVLIACLPLNSDKTLFLFQLPVDQLTFSKTESVDSEQETEHDTGSSPSTYQQVEYFKIKWLFWELWYQDAFKGVT